MCVGRSTGFSLAALAILTLSPSLSLSSHCRCCCPCVCVHVCVISYHHTHTVGNPQALGAKPLTFVRQVRDSAVSGGCLTWGWVGGELGGRWVHLGCFFALCNATPFPALTSNKQLQPNTPHQHPHTPYTPTQVVALCAAPFLLDDPNVSVLFPADAVERARSLTASFGRGGVGGYTDSRGNYGIRSEVADFIERRDGHRPEPEVRG